MTQLTLQPILAGAALMNPEVAAADIFNGAHNTEAMEVFLGALSGVVDQYVSADLAEKFRREYRNFSAKASGYRGKDKDPRAQAKVEIQFGLVPLIRRLTPEQWQTIVEAAHLNEVRMNRFTTREAAIALARETLRRKLSGWRPEVHVKAPTVVIQNIGLSAVDRMLDLNRILHVSIVRQEKKIQKPWADLLFESGLLDASEIHFEWNLLDKDSPTALAVKWRAPHKNGAPTIGVSFRKDIPIKEGALLYLILRSFAHVHHPTMKLSLRDMEAIGDDPEKRRDWKYVEYLMYRGGQIFPYVSHVRIIQTALIGRAEKKALSEAMEAIEIPLETREQLLKRLDNLQLRLTIEEQAETARHPYAVSFTYLPANSKDLLEGDRRKIPTLILHLALPKDTLRQLNQENAWAFIARAFAIWVQEGSPKLKGAQDSQRYPLFVLDKETVTLVGKVSFHVSEPVTSLDPRIPMNWAHEVDLLLKWLSHINKKKGVFQDFPVLKEVKEGPAHRDLSALWALESLLTRIDLIHQPKEVGEVVMKANFDGEESRVTFEGDFREITKVSPFDLVMAAQEALSRRRQGGQGERLVVSRSLIDVATKQIEILEWFKLLWECEKALASPPKKPAKLYLRGEAIEKDRDTIGREIIRALAQHQRREPKWVDASFAKQRFWFVEYPSEKAAQKFSVVVISRAKLILFDGKPDFSPSDWERITEILLNAPEGFTVVEPAHSWRSNRPILVAQEGEERWYELNPHYRGATPTQKLLYREALAFVRRIASRHENLTPPTPASKRADIRSVKMALVRIYHPDVRLPQGKRDEEEVMRNLNKYFAILEEFHRR